MKPEQTASTVEDHEMQLKAQKKVVSKPLLRFLFILLKPKFQNHSSLKTDLMIAQIHQSVNEWFIHVAGEFSGNSVLLSVMAIISAHPSFACLTL